MPLYYQETQLKNIANAIRAKTGRTDQIAAKDFSSTILGLDIVNSAVDRPTQWLSTNSNTSGDFVNLLVAIFPNNTSPISFAATGSNYSVDWGDDTTTNYNAAETATHTYSYANVSSDTFFEQRGYRQAVIKILPDTALSTINFNIKPAGVLSNDASSTILEINGKIGNCSGISLRGNTSSANISHRMLESITIAGNNSQSDFNYLFSSCYSLKSVNIDMSNATSLDSTFSYCDSLEKIYGFNSANVTNFNNCFFRCSSLGMTPSINFTNAANLTNIFNYCYNLREVNMVQNTLTKNIVINGMMMTAEAINYMFSMLPDRTGLTALIITVADCPGKVNCNTSIATTKNWSVVLS